MSIFPPSLPEKFSSALQPETLLDLLQIEGMKIEEESEVKWPLSPPLPWVVSSSGAGALRDEHGCLQSWDGGFSRWQGLTQSILVATLLDAGHRNPVSLAGAEVGSWYGLVRGLLADLGGRVAQWGP